MNWIKSILLSLGLCFTAQQPAFAEDLAQSRQQIEKVIESFQTAIVKKDRDTFMKLFLKPDITWTGVLPDKSIDMLYAKRPKPEMLRPSKSFNSSPSQFIEFIANSPSPFEETISNVRIDSDGEVAQVWFDYVFKAGDYKENWGKESWQMVRLESGWKIAAVVWSQELNPVPLQKP